MYLRVDVIDKIMPYIENRTFMNYGILWYPLYRNSANDILEFVQT